MVLSEVIEKSGMTDQCKIVLEREFDTFERVTYQGNASICVAVDNEKYWDKIPASARMVLTTRELYEKKQPLSIGVGIAEKPWELLFVLHNWLYRNEKNYGRKKQKTKIGKGCKISPLAFIAEENVLIGDNVTIEEFVSIKANTVIGNNSIIMSGCAIGGNGLEYKKIDNDYTYIEHAGGTVIGDNVSLHSNVIVNKAVFPTENTYVGNGTKIDSFTIIAHGVSVGANNMITTSCALAGRVRAGDDVFFSPGAVVSHNLTIGDGSIVNIGAVVTQNMEPGSVVSGNFAIDHSKFVKHIKKISK